MNQPTTAPESVEFPPSATEPPSVEQDPDGHPVEATSESKVGLVGELIRIVVSVAVIALGVFAFENNVPTRNTGFRLLTTGCWTVTTFLEGAVSSR